MGKMLLACSRALGRVNLWAAAAWVLSLARGSQWNGALASYFAYACMLGRNSACAQGAFRRALRNQLDRSAEANLWLAEAAWRLGRFGLSEAIAARTCSRYPESVQAVAAARQVEFARSVRNGRLAAALAAAVEEATIGVPVTEPILLVPASSRYVELFGLWRQQVAVHAGGQLIVLAMDERTQDALDSPHAQRIINLSPYFDFDAEGKIESHSKRHLWAVRVIILAELVRRGYKVVSLDLDAVLVGDLFPMLHAMPAADIVIQKDYSIPIDVARKLGFIVCCGFLAVTPNEATRRFLERYAQQTCLELDDQTAVNHMLAEDPPSERKTTGSYMTFKSCGLTWVCPDPSLVSRDVSYGRVVRHFQQEGQSVEELQRQLGLDAANSQSLKG